MSKFHRFHRMNTKEYREELSKLIDTVSKNDKIPGGLAEGKKPSDFSKLKIDQGVKVEMEHTSDPKIAQEIAMDHLTEDKDYYKKLKQIETKKSEDINKNGASSKKGVIEGWNAYMKVHPKMGGVVHFAHPSRQDLVSVHKDLDTGSYHVKHNGKLANLGSVEGKFKTSGEALEHARNYIKNVNKKIGKSNTEASLDKTVRSPRKGHTIGQLQNLKEMGWYNPNTGTEMSEEEGEAHLMALRQRKADKQVKEKIKPRAVASSSKPEDWFGKNKK